MNNDNKTNQRDSQWRSDLRAKLTASQRKAIPRVKMTELDPAYRITCNAEVNSGITPQQAAIEASRCMDCPNPQCVTGCPVGIDIPGFIKNIELGDIDAASGVLRATSALPAVCGRVCPQEKQCESRCIYNKMNQPPVAIGYLERFAADNATHISNDRQKANGIKVAVAGSGPAGLSFAGDMARMGFDVTVFEALHEIGGVLKYGIPQFRLPNSIVDKEIEALQEIGVKFVKDTIIGKTISHDQLTRMGFKGLFVASGAGLPRFMNIPGENYIGVMSSNEYLTRINLMGAGQQGFDTPMLPAVAVAVIGGGNTAMDSVRTALRMGASRVMLVYRRSEEEMPARLEEIRHAKEEGVELLTLHNPIEYLADETGRVRAMRLQRMQLGEPDASGRRSPEPIEGDIVEVPVDMVIVSVGVSPNPIIPQSIPDLQTTPKHTISVDTDTMQTSIPTIFAGGDIVRGGATVILAMGDGRRAAASMAKMLTK